MYMERSCKRDIDFMHR